MGLFSKEKCILCGTEVGPLVRTKMNDGNFLCNNCVAKTKLSDGYNIDTLKSSSLDEIKKRIEFVDNDLKENSERISAFIPTYKVDAYVWFDDNHKWFVFPKTSFTTKIDNCYVFKYEDVLDFEVLEDGTSITKGGLGKALVGGAIFGLAGAIVGGTSKKTKQMCNKLQIKITTRNLDKPIIYLTLINSETKKNGFIYKQASKCVQEILSKFQIVIDQIEQTQNESLNSRANNFSAADEVKKYKDLLDMGAITKEEFDMKKKELLKL